MLELTGKSAKQWSRLGPRAVYGMTMLKLVEEKEDIYTLSADLGMSSGLQRLMNQYPERYINVGIAEQNLIGVSAGFAKAGIIPFASSFAPFITARCADQIRMNMGYMKLNIKLVGLGSGVSMGYLGASHYGIEDISMLRSIPGITILSPADCGELAKCLYAAAEYEGPVYIRLTGEPGMPVVYTEDYDYQIGKVNVLREGKEVVLLATGSMVHEALLVADMLKDENIDCTVVDVHTIKPLDTEALIKYMEDSKLVVTIEEHSIIGGLGSAVAECIADSGIGTQLVRCGLSDRYYKAGAYDYMKEQHDLISDRISSMIMEKIN